MVVVFLLDFSPRYSRVANDCPQKARDCPKL